MVSYKFLNSFIERNRITLSFVGGALFLYLAAPTAATILAGAPFIFIGEAIRTCASGFIRKNEALAQEGPYALTRNPLYLGNFLIGTGFSIMTSRIILLIPFLIAFYLIYSATIKKEEKLLLTRFGDSFLRYKKRVPVFFPLKITPRHLCVNFDWKLVMKHREHLTWLGIFGGLIIFLFKFSFSGVS